jgi:DNA-binding NarL/FixJ family response regulator
MESEAVTPSLVVVDDHEALCAGLEILLERQGFHVLACATSAAEGERTISEHHPEMAVVDINLHDEPGTQLIRRMSARTGSPKFVVYTDLTDPSLLFEAMGCGAEGFVAKPGGVPSLVEGLREVFRGGSYRDPSLVRFSHGNGQRRARALSRRETEILELLAAGCTGEQIAERLVLSPETIRTHVRNAMGKLEAHTRTEAVVKAIERKEIRQE